MRRLTGLDATFLAAETSTTHMHTTGTVVLDPSTAPSGWSHQSIRDLFEARVHLMAPFRQRLVSVPLGLGRPLLVEDPDFDVDRHLHRVALPAPGTERELADFVGHVAGVPLDRNRPLWELWVVEGLEGGRVALVAKVHHAIMDGVSGAESMAHLFDLEPTPPGPPPEDDWRPERLPGDLELIGHSLASQVRTPVRLAQTVGRTARGLARAAGLLRRGASSPALPFSGPRTPFNTAITPHRTVAFASADLDLVKEVKGAYGVTVNDVVLAACARSLRRWLVAHDAAPDRPLVCAVPMSTRPEDDASLGNQVTVMFVSLPVHIEDPVEALHAVHGEAGEAKELTQALGPETLTEWVDYISPRVAGIAMRLTTRMHFADRMPPFCNLVVSNVPGPPLPLYCAGARVEKVYPMGPVGEGTALNITVLSNTGTLDFGALACREALPDLWDIATGFTEAVDELRRLSGRTTEPAPA